MKRILIFAEFSHHGQFAPLDDLRPAFLIRDGAWTVAERWASLLHPDTIGVIARSSAMEEVVGELTGWGALPDEATADADVWIIVGAANTTSTNVLETELLDSELHWSAHNAHVIRTTGEQWIAAREKLEHWLRGDDECPFGPSLEEHNERFQSARGLWDFIHRLSMRLKLDWELWNQSAEKSSKPRADETSIIRGDESIWCGRDVKLSSHVVIDATQGPIILEDGVRIEPFTHLIGPAAIGKGTSLLGGKFDGGTSIGPGCKIAGEWEQSIAQGFANKAHVGFFGHGILGEWVNLGAMTTNSDLKNTYGTVRVLQNGKTVDTGLMKVGSFLGDHTKTGIGTLIGTGATLGVGVNVYGGILAPRDIPSFVWQGPDSAAEHQFDKMVSTAGAAVGRRADILSRLGRPEQLTEAQQKLLRDVFDQSAPTRLKFLQQTQ